MTGRKVRHKKLGVKTPLPVLREGEVSASEYDALTTEIQISTGVDHAEEKEYHLQSILRDAGTSNDQEIPVPPPQPSNVQYDVLYAGQWEEPRSYIRSSNTVEESISVSGYNMTTQDDAFLTQYNSSRPADAQLSEDDFERVMEVFEGTSSEQTPFAAVDNTIIPYDRMVPSLASLDSSRLKQHAKAVYEYWAERRNEAGNKALQPSLKYEMGQETDDSDPYVCFRRREARQTRKTRARDVQMAEKLKRLRRELEEGMRLVAEACEREKIKREYLNVERDVFESRQKLRELKVMLKISAEDTDLYNHKPPKRRAAEPAAAPRAPLHLRMPAASRPEVRPVETDLVLLVDRQAEKENRVLEDMEQKVQNHRAWNEQFVDLTSGPLPPVRDQTSQVTYRPAKTQYLMTPPASVSSDIMDVDDVGHERRDEDEEDEGAEDRGRRDRDVMAMLVNGGRSPAEPWEIWSGGAKKAPTQSPPPNPAYRRRIGRLNRLWIDRRGLAARSGPSARKETDEYADRWKFDQDDDQEPPVYELDPFDVSALHFRSQMPMQYFTSSRRWQQVARHRADGSAGSAPATAAAVAAAGHGGTAVAGAPSAPPAPSAAPAPAPAAETSSSSSSVPSSAAAVAAAAAAALQMANRALLVQQAHRAQPGVRSAPSQPVAQP